MDVQHLYLPVSHSIASRILTGTRDIPAAPTTSISKTVILKSRSSYSSLNCGAMAGSRSSDLNDLRRRGIVPPPARVSGSRVFKSKRRTRPNAGRMAIDKPYSKPSSSSSYSSKRHRRQPSAFPGLAPTMATRSMTRLIASFRKFFKL